MAIVFFAIFDCGCRNLDCFILRSDRNSRSHETILDVYSFANDDIDTIDNTSVDDTAAFIDVDIRTCDFYILHRCTIGKICKNAIGFFGGFL